MMLYPCTQEVVVLGKAYWLEDTKKQHFAVYLVRLIESLGIEAGRYEE
jgi:hypothetical protein